MRAPLLLVLIAACSIAGCAAAGVRSATTPAQLQALQVRDSDRAPEEAFAASARALLDAGYTITVHDPASRLITGEFREDPPSAPNYALAATLAFFTGVPYTLPSTRHGVSMHITPRPPSGSRIRIQPFINGTADEDAATADQIWVLLERQSLLRAP